MIDVRCFIKIIKPLQSPALTLNIDFFFFLINICENLDQLQRKLRNQLTLVHLKEIVRISHHT